MECATSFNVTFVSEDEFCVLQHPVSDAKVKITHSKREKTFLNMNFDILVAIPSFRF